VIDLAVSMRAAIVADPAITADLTAWKGTFPVFTRRPIPPDAPYPVIVVSPDVAVSDEDMLDTPMVMIVRDIAVYGRNAEPDDYRTVEALAYRVRDLFHRERFSLAPAGWRVVDVRASGPVPAPTDDADVVGRVVTLTVRVTPSS
jgi:hypothetical protein